MMNQQTRSNAIDGRPPAMTPEAFAQLGVGHFAYIKPVVIEGQTVAGIFSADGQQIGLTATPDIARAAAIQHSLEPVSVH